MRGVVVAFLVGGLVAVVVTVVLVALEGGS
jgi:hypothetical protein